MDVRLRERFQAEATRRNLTSAEALHQAMEMWLTPPTTPPSSPRLPNPQCRVTRPSQKDVAAEIGVRYWRFVKWLNGDPLPVHGEEVERFITGLSERFGVTPEHVRETRCVEYFR